MKVLFGTSEDKKDIMNATTSVYGAQDFVDKKVTLLGMWTLEKPDEKGEMIPVTSFKLRDGDSIVFCSSISPTVAQSVDTITELYSCEEISSGIDVMFKTKTAKSGRDFIYLTLA